MRLPASLMMALSCALSLGASGAATSAPVQGDRLSLLDRATASVEAFVQQFSTLVADEQYVQRVAVTRATRELISDFLLTKSAGSAQWHQFRDVRIVDGRYVGDRDLRLLALFLQPSADVDARAERLLREGARHNLVDVGSVNLPLNAMGFLQARYRGRFRFTTGRLDRSVGEDVRVVGYEEIAPETLLRTETRARQPSRGRLWVHEPTGRLARTELIIGDDLARVVVSFAWDETLQLNLPVSMEDEYSMSREGLVSGKATYSSFRRFQVVAEEAITAPREADTGRRAR